MVYLFYLFFISSKQLEKMPFDLTGKVAVVYGGSYGIGLGVAETLSNAGAKIAVVSRNTEKGKGPLKSNKVV